MPPKEPEKARQPSEVSPDAADNLSQPKKTTEELPNQNSSKDASMSMNGSIFNKPSQNSKSVPKLTSSKTSSFTRDIKKDTIKLKDQMLYATKLGNCHEDLKDHFESSLQEELFQMTKEANQLSLLDLVDIVYNI
jgi:hypothetical protein